MGDIGAVKCLSLNQPYAELISGKKTIEVRRRNQLQRAVPRTRVQKDKRRGMQQTEAKLVTGAIVGEANLYDVISYQSKHSFLKDKNKHFASSNYGNPKYGFLLNQTKRLSPYTYSW